MSAQGEVTPADVAAMMAGAKQTAGVVVGADGSTQDLQAAQLAAPEPELAE